MDVSGIVCGVPIAATVACSSGMPSYTTVSYTECWRERAHKFDFLNSNFASRKTNVRVARPWGGTVPVEVAVVAAPASCALSAVTGVTKVAGCAVVAAFGADIIMH